MSDIQQLSRESIRGERERGRRKRKRGGRKEGERDREIDSVYAKICNQVRLFTRHLEPKGVTGIEPRCLSRDLGRTFRRGRSKGQRLV